MEKNWTVFIAEENGSLAIGKTNADWEKFPKEQVVWFRGEYTQDEATALMNVLHKFTQAQLADYVKNMNKPAQVIVFKEKKS